MTPHRQYRAATVITGALLVAGFIYSGVSPAVAHNTVEELVPEPGSTVQSSPLIVSIGTNDDFLDITGDARGFVVVALDSEGAYYGDGCVEIVERRMTAELALGEAGTYTIAYQFVSADGHSLQESYTIEFEPGPAHSAAPGAPIAPVCDEAPYTAELDTSPALGETAATEAATEEQGLLLFIGAIIAFTAAAGVVVWAVLARKRRA